MRWATLSNICKFTLYIKVFIALKMKFLLIEDEKKIARNIKEKLECEHYLVDWADDGNRGLEMALMEEYDLILLDIMLPGMDGFTILKQLRNSKIESPVLLLTARSEVDDKVKGLDLGADDYLTKPFSLAELLARIRALLRRNYDYRTSVLTAADLVLNPSTREVTRNKKTISLTPKEFAILEFLLYNKNHVLSRLTIAEHVWGDNFETMTNFVDVHIKNLRHKIDREFTPRLIHTIRGIGYMLKEK